MHNALAAVAAAHHVGVKVVDAVGSLSTFSSVKRRMEKIYEGSPYGSKIRVFDDFAHHPTAIEQTVSGLRNSVGQEQILAILEPRSNTMKQGVHKNLLPRSLDKADSTLIYASDQVKWDIHELADEKITTYSESHALLEGLIHQLQTLDQPANILIMSNGDFEGLYDRLIEKLSYRSS